MQLSDQDLEQIDEAYLDSLSTDKLRKLSVKVLADLKEAHARLEQNSANSAQPTNERSVPPEKLSASENDRGEKVQCSARGAAEVGRHR
jgi:hypothetical protein